MNTQTLREATIDLRPVIDSAVHAGAEFLADIEAFTIPCDGGRRFVAIASPSALSESFERASGAVRIAEAAMRQAGVDPFGTLAASLQVLESALLWPVERHNEENARAPGRVHEHRRFRWGEVLGADFIACLRAGMLALQRAPLPTQSASFVPLVRPHSGHRLAAEALAWIATHHPEASTVPEFYTLAKASPAYDGTKRPHFATFKRYVSEVRRMSRGESTPGRAA